MHGNARFTILTRLGFAARGLLYLVIAFLVIAAGRAADPAAALSYLQRGSGKWLLMLMAAGFVGYGLWRLADAILNIEGHDRKPKGVGQRLGALVSGIVHLFLAWQAFRLASGPSSLPAGGGAEESAQAALSLPGGALMLIVGGLILAGVGIVQFGAAATCSFCDDLSPEVARRPWVRWSGRLGYAARGLVFLITGYFLARAGFAERAGEAGGMEQALRWLDNPWDVIVAIGLLMFGLFSLVEARFRIIHEVPMDELASRARSKLPA